MKIGTIKSEIDGSRLVIEAVKEDDGFVVLADGHDALLGEFPSIDAAKDACATAWMFFDWQEDEED